MKNTASHEVRISRSTARKKRLRRFGNNLVERNDLNTEDRILRLSPHRRSEEAVIRYSSEQGFASHRDRKNRHPYPALQTGTCSRCWLNISTISMLPGPQMRPLFEAGHRICLAVTCADRDNGQTPELNPAPKVTVYRDQQRPSCILLPVYTPK